jgi:hypothetical protein
MVKKYFYLFKIFKIYDLASVIVKNLIKDKEYSICYKLNNLLELYSKLNLNARDKGALRIS